ncbi:ArsR family transcriptional regulator [Methanothermobacter sp. K4]|uniref:ArsR/SmtB family transcription factor n=1 Tax=Methanothermobacter sp. K4 TaxID=2913262 RepID=UPI001EDA78DF|nr:ArsR family transcriptional regulator [Methanothermobacter sp. K4]MCG2828059.1 ArsR family transcriptional regulator [Methanothermobacter sp. K4]
MREKSTEERNMEVILDVMGCKTRREIINLLREEPRFVSEISKELDIGQKAIIEHLRAMEEAGILSSFFRKIERGRPRKYYDISRDIHISITINRNNFRVDVVDDLLRRKQLPPGDEWSRLLNIENKLMNGQWEAIEELKNLIRLYEHLKKRAEDLLREAEMRRKME